MGEITKKNMMGTKFRKTVKKEKEAKNLSKTGFKIRTKHRYRLDAGRIGVCKFRGRTAFGKSGEDWVGIMVEYGAGDHDGSVDGKSYFRCKDGKGIMVRPSKIIQDLGLPNNTKVDGKMIHDTKGIKHLLKNRKKSMYD